MARTPGSLPAAGRPPAGAPWAPAKYTVAQAAAVQALSHGTADKEQQIRALKWIVEDVCGTYDMSYRPDSTRDSDFAEGKRFVGNQIVKMTVLNIANLRSENG